MNVELLERVKAHILEEPKRFHMPAILYRSLPVASDPRFPACGTMGCFAGWICALSGKEDFWDISAKEAQKLVGINDEQAARLFFGSPETWSSQDRQGLWAGDGSPETAVLAARRLDLFIESGGSV